MATQFSNISVSDTITTNNITCNSLVVNESEFLITDIFSNGSIHCDTIINNTYDSINIQAPIINIGYAGATGTVNILGNLNYINTEQLQVKDPLITLNKGGTITDVNCGLEVELNDSITHSIKIYGVGATGAGWTLSGDTIMNGVTCSNINSTSATISNLTAGITQTNNHLFTGSLSVNGNTGPDFNSVNINNRLGVTGPINIGNTGTTTTLNGKIKIPSNINNVMILGTEDTTPIANGVPLMLKNGSNIDNSVNGSIVGASGATGVYPQLSYGYRNWTWADDVSNNLLMYFGCAGAAGNDPDFEYIFKRGTGLKIQPNIGTTGADFTEALNVVGNANISGNANITGAITVGTFSVDDITLGTITFNPAIALPTLNTHLGWFGRTAGSVTVTNVGGRVMRDVITISNLPPGVWRFDVTYNYVFSSGILGSSNEIGCIVSTTAGTDPYTDTTYLKSSRFAFWDYYGSSTIFFWNPTNHFSYTEKYTTTSNVYVTMTGGNTTTASGAYTYKASVTYTRVG